MAWQPPSAMAGGGGFAGDGAANGGHPQGTEYTLQGELGGSSCRILRLYFVLLFMVVFLLLKYSRGMTEWLANGFRS